MGGHKQSLGGARPPRSDGTGLNVIIPFSIIVCSHVIEWCSKNSLWVNLNGEAQAAVKGGAAPWSDDFVFPQFLNQRVEFLPGFD